MKVLIVDDDPVSRHLLHVSLSSAGYETTVVTDGTEALQVLGREDCPRLVVLDWMMPHMDGVDVCRAIRRRASEPYIYIVLLTVKGEQEEIVEGLEAGADDYVTKPFDLLELKARLRAGKRILELQEQLVASREQLRFEANHDSLTGLLNRSAVLEILRKEVVRSKREGTPVGVIMADIDTFKSINDSYGHLAGDTVLREAARRMRSLVRAYDSVGRYGGEEFLLVIPGCGMKETMALAERLRECISNDPVIYSSEAIKTTISLGVATASDAKDADHVLRRADEALYAAKTNGRNKVESAIPAGAQVKTKT